MRVIGTAGHVDHGKSSLVRALSGIDPDRLQEEKARGMTIDLGFAWLDLPGASGRPEAVGIVDVPGHIDFIKNMLAGVGGIDAALLIVAADEGVMPQTREHLAILHLMGVTQAVVAMTKIDLIDDEEWLDLVELEIDELLEGTDLAGAPVVRVSAHTGVGLDALRIALAHALAELPPRRNRARPRLPIDRIFSLSGFGTIVTGTLSDGRLRVGDRVEILPAGLEARVRGLQTHKQPVEEGEPGSRLAINLTGVSVEDLHRGDVVARPGDARATTLLDVSFRLLADVEQPLPHNCAVDFFTGAAETPARVRVLGVEQIEPGGQGWLQLRLARPVAAEPGDRYILRRPSPSSTLGGGVILDAHPRRRWKRFDPAVIERLETLAQGTPGEILLQTLERTPLTTLPDLLARSGLDLETARAAYADLMATDAVLELGAGQDAAILSAGQWQEITGQLVGLLADFHAQAPLRRGLPHSEARTRLTIGGRTLSPRLFAGLAERAGHEGLVQADDSFIWQAGFAPQPTPGQQAAVTRTLAAFAAAPFTPPNQAETLKLLGNDEALLEMLVEQSLLLRFGGILLRPEDFLAMRTVVTRHLRDKGSITLAETRDLFSTSRKYAQAMLEELDAQRVTRRQGDLRVLRGGEG
ncbi:MAG: selenocysteine-specific translation elongation factor [Caldilineaceae bacterium]|nr:selenocysteine-specific translation elongation factor [Caldilineaceae bacterium]